MAKVRIDVNKLENATAEFISLVQRSNTRLPFKILKSHPNPENDPMINVGGKLDLSDIRNLVAKQDKPDDDSTDIKPSRGERAVKADAIAPVVAAPKPTIVGIVVEKGDHMDADTIKELHALGVPTDKAIENEDGTVLYPLSDEEATVVVKMSGNMLALVADLDPAPITEGTIYASIYDELGFMPSPEEALAGTVTKTDDDDVKKVAAHNAEINTYIERLTNAVPELAFKADEIVTKACKKRKALAQKALDEAEAIRKVEAEPVPCPMCESKGCKACGGEGKVMKADLPRMELLMKAFPPKKPAAAAAAAPAAEVAPAAPAAPAAEAKPPVAAEGEAPLPNAGDDTAPEGVDQDAWTTMTPDEKATVHAAAQGSTAPAAPAAAAPAAAPVAAPAPAGQDPATMPAAAPAPAAAAAPKKPPFPAKKEDGSQEGTDAGTLPAMDVTVQKSLDSITAMLQTVVKSQNELSETVKAQATEIAALKGNVQKTEKAIQSTVIGAVPAEDHAPAARVEKSDHVGLIDTAYQPHVRTQKSYGERAQIAHQRHPARRM